MGYPPLHSPLSLWITHLEIFPERAFFVLCCAREEGLGSQLATYWLFQSPDPVVWLECVALLCTVTTCQVSGWDKTGVRMTVLGTIGGHKQTLQNLNYFFHPSVQSWGTSVTWGEEEEELNFSDEYLSGFELPSLFQLISLRLQWPEAMKVSHLIWRGLPLSAVR